MCMHTAQALIDRLKVFHGNIPRRRGLEGQTIAEKEDMLECNRDVTP